MSDPAGNHVQAAHRILGIFFIAITSSVALAGDYETELARIMHGKIMSHMDNIVEALTYGDYELACSEYRTAALLVKWNFNGLKKLDPSKDWMLARQSLNESIESVCVPKGF